MCVRAVLDTKKSYTACTVYTQYTHAQTYHSVTMQHCDGKCVCCMRRTPKMRERELRAKNQMCV